MKTSLAALAVCVAALAAPALAQDSQAAPAEAVFIDTQEQEIGTVTLTETADGVRISGTVSGIPAGEHGFHIHSVGNCDAATNFESAGGHFAPNDNQHGFDNPEGPHAGDMRNQTADADNTLNVDATNDMVSLTEGEEGYLLDDDGSAIVIHSGPDDYVTDPGGNSGDRIACAVIGAPQ